jgi:hypothetical protein
MPCRDKRGKCCWTIPWNLLSIIPLSLPTGFIHSFTVVHIDLTHLNFPVILNFFPTVPSETIDRGFSAYDLLNTTAVWVDTWVIQAINNLFFISVKISWTQGNAICWIQMWMCTHTHIQHHNSKLPVHVKSHTTFFGVI